MNDAELGGYVRDRPALRARPWCTVEVRAQALAGDAGLALNHEDATGWNALPLGHRLRGDAANLGERADAAGNANGLREALISVSWCSCHNDT